MDHAMKRAAVLVLFALAPAAFAQTINVRVVVLDRFAGAGVKTALPDHLDARELPVELRAVTSAAGENGYGVASIDRFVLAAEQTHDLKGMRVTLRQLGSHNGRVAVHIDGVADDFEVKVPVNGTVLLAPNSEAEAAEFVAVSLFDDATAARIPEVFMVGGDVKAPQVMSRVNPFYPEESRAKGVSGLVIMQTQIDEAGNVMEARVLKGEQQLAVAAVTAVKQWHFQPATRNGHPVRVLFHLTMQFKLK